MNIKKFKNKDCLNHNIIGYEPSKKNIPKNIYDKALYFLREKYVPSILSCRKYEKEYIEEFILNGINNNSSSEILYVSGTPGLGKTACILEITKNLLKNKPKSAKYLYINSLNLSNPYFIYTEFYNLLFDKKKVPIKAKNSLEKIFNKDTNNKKSKKKINVPIVLILDEIDYLYTKDQEVLYNFFNWAIYGKLIILGIANTLDFPEKLNPRVKSRMGNKILVFKPYSFSDIESILKQRINETKIFESNAITFISKKITNISPDIRKSLNICRRTIQEYRQKYPEFNNKIKIEFVQKIFNSSYNSSVTDFIKTSSDYTKIVLKTIANQINKSYNKNELKYLKLEEIIELSINQLSTHKTSKLRPIQIIQIIEKLQNYNLLIVKSDFKTKEEKIIMKIDSDDILFPLQNDELFKNDIYN